MIDINTDFFKIIDNFEKIRNIPSIKIIESKLDFIPKVTIAIPTYKRFDLLKEAIDSAINQRNYIDYDIIVVDNDSTRGCETEKLLRSYNNNRITYYKNSENIGMAGNWNRLFELAVGGYVVMLHDDDILLPDFLVEGMEILNKDIDIDILKPQFYQFMSQSKDINYSEIPKLDSKLYKIDLIAFYQGCLIGAPTGIFFKKNSVLKVGGFNPDYFPSLDYCFYILFSNKFNIFYLNKILSLYRIGANESLNIKTLNGFVVSDYFLIMQILIQYGIPKQIVKNYLRKRTDDVVKIYKENLNAEFTFDFNILGIKPINKRIGSIYVLGLRSFFLIRNLVKKDKIYLTLNSK